LAAAKKKKSEPQKKKKEPPHVIVGGAKITNPDKLHYPEAAITKRHVAEYYEAVSDWLLPHIKERPTTFVRCHNGWNRGGFFQKHPKGGLAEGVRVVIIGKDDVLVVDDKKTLIGLAQMNVLEVHVWGAHLGALDRPDLLIFDLDPDVAVDWKEVVATAKLVRDRLGVESFIKTTGGKGLHVCCRTPNGMKWKEAREFGWKIAEHMVRDFPERYLTDISKAKRKGKILLDFARNHPGATYVAPYSPRARANAPVSTPITWDELDTVLPSQLTIKTVVDRLRTVGDPWSALRRAE
jgi:bifunctional non-homologous end joining protein LigD